ncbi:hypothetical protein L5G28_15925 [Gordonia sp. HY285]|uniref:hypothetical protein n=1 Tax=Gordonia liuliyuniae TaxID=2911517 RepID=UPI001F34B6DC|nr:hypothetical protein [Gordonia liuliyuniae]MCF8611634.1 hypothetical protein [Gordonia liuliyuniae]
MDDQTTTTRVKAVGVTLSIALGVLAFVAPWVRVSVDGEDLFALTLSHRVLDAVPFFDGAPSGSPWWGIAFAVVAACTALAVLNAATATDASTAARSGGAAFAVGLLASLIRRAAGLDLAIPDESPVDVHMAWGFWVAVASAVGLVVVPWFVGGGSEEDESSRGASKLVGVGLSAATVILLIGTVVDANNDDDDASDTATQDHTSSDSSAGRVKADPFDVGRSDNDDEASGVPDSHEPQLAPEAGSEIELEPETFPSPPVADVSGGEWQRGGPYPTGPACELDRRNANTKYTTSSDCFTYESSYYYWAYVKEPSRTPVTTPMPGPPTDNPVSGGQWQYMGPYASLWTCEQGQQEYTSYSMSTCFMHEGQAYFWIYVK